MYEENFVSVQVYILHLLDGNTVKVKEEYDLPWEKGFIHLFEQAEESRIFIVNNDLNIIYIPKRSIVSISTGNVEKIDKETWQLCTNRKCRKNK